MHIMRKGKDVAPTTAEECVARRAPEASRIHLGVCGVTDACRYLRGGRRDILTHQSPREDDGITTTKKKITMQPFSHPSTGLSITRQGHPETTPSIESCFTGINRRTALGFSPFSCAGDSCILILVPRS